MIFRRFMTATNFNPRPLAGATYTDADIDINNGDFNPRPLAGATNIQTELSREDVISIHAPLRGRQKFPQEIKLLT